MDLNELDRRIQQLLDILEYEIKPKEYGLCLKLNNRRKLNKSTRERLSGYASLIYYNIEHILDIFNELYDEGYGSDEPYTLDDLKTSIQVLRDQASQYMEYLENIRTHLINHSSARDTDLQTIRKELLDLVVEVRSLIEHTNRILELFEERSGGAKKKRASLKKRS